MQAYHNYMDRQSLSPEAHERLLHMPEEHADRSPHRIPWKTISALAACCALVIGLALYSNPLVQSPGSGEFHGNILPGSASEATSSAQSQTDSSGHSDSNPGSQSSFSAADSDMAPGTYVVPDRPGEQSQAALPMLYAISYPDVTGTPQLSGSPNLQLMEGSFTRDLTANQICGLFGNPDSGIPWMLMWDGYSLQGSALYDSSGALIQADLTGTKDEDTFSLTLAPDSLPFSCGQWPDASVTMVRDIPVTGYSIPDENMAVSEMQHGNIGARFESVSGNPVSKDGLEAACNLNSLFVNWFSYEDCSLTLDGILQAEEIPEWRSADFTTLEEALRETEFVRFLPKQDPAGYGEFSGHLTYQEGNEHTLSVLWSRGYDDIAISVYLPEGDVTWEVTDVDLPESYDVRLYEIPWCDTVPEEYQNSISNPTFRAEDMSLAVVEARGAEKDTGGMRYCFDVLHPDGTLVSYNCSGIQAADVWNLVEATLAES